MKSFQPVKVLYFTYVPLAKPDNGGSIVCRYHVERLAACKGIELHVSTFGSADQESETCQFISALGAQYHPIFVRAPRRASEFVRSWHPAWRWNFLFEAQAHENPHVDRQFRTLLDLLKPDVVVIDYLLSALFIRSVFSIPVRIVTITLNKEAAFHAQLRRLGRLQSGVSQSIIAEWRLARFERSVYRNSDAVVVLSEGDFPTDRRGRSKTTVVEPILDQSSDRWRFLGRRELFFVGNIAHYPNFLAVKWIAEQFAPALVKRCPDARIRIVGTSADQIEPEWNRDNIDYMGRCDEQTLTNLFKTSDLFIAPIENNFGAKMKIMQCLAHGTPILATRGALSGVPFKSIIPQFSLNDADGAAEIVSNLLSNEAQLNELSQKCKCEHALLLDKRDDAWLHLIAKVKAQPLRSISLPSLLSPLRPIADKSISQPWPKSLEIGVEEPQGILISGMHPLERIDQGPLRWTSEIAEIELPLNQKTLPTVLTLRLFGIAPANGTDFCVLLSGSELFSGRVLGQPINEIIRLPDLRSMPVLRIRLESSGWQPEGDARTLGVAISSISLSRL